MTCFDRELANRVALFLAAQGGCIRTATVLDIDVVFHTYPEVRDILGEPGFQRPAEAWAWIDERLSAHRVLMGHIAAQGLQSKSLAQQEDDGA